MDLIEISRGKVSAVISTAGAELKKLNVGGSNIMWRGDAAYWGKTSPFLFPMIGNLAEGKTIIDGKEYRIGKHGFARDNEFAAERTGENSATFTFSANDKTMESFPFDFCVSLSYGLTERGVRIDYAVKNRSDVAMPYCIGAHPAIACDSVDGCSLYFEKNETVNTPVMNLNTRRFSDGKRIPRLSGTNTVALNYPMFDEDCVYFDTINSKSVLLGRDGVFGVRVGWEGFTSLGVWTPAGMNAPFICIEPWCGCDDFDTDDGIFRNKRGVQECEPGGEKRYALTIERV